MGSPPYQLIKPSPPATSSDQVILLAAKGGGIALIGNLFVYVVRFASGLVVARLLGAEPLGLFSLGMTFPEMAGTLAVLGLNVGVARYIPIAMVKKDEPMLRGIIQIGIAIPCALGLALALGTYIFTDVVSFQIYGQPALAPVLRLASWSVPLFALMTVLEGITQGFKRMEFKVYSEDMTLNVLKLLLTFMFVGAGLGVMGAVAAYIVSLVIAVMMLFIFTNSLFSLYFPRQEVKHNFRELFRFSLPVYLTQFLLKFNGSIGMLILGVFGTIGGVGIFAVALRVSAIGTLFYISLMRIAAPMIAELHNQAKIDQLGRMYQTMTKWGMIFNLPVFLTTALFAQPILSIFGQDFVAGETVLTILAAAALFDTCTGFCGTIITMTGNSNLSLANSVITVLVSIGLNLLLVPRWGLLGVAIAFSLWIVMLNTLRLVEVFLLLKIQPYNLGFVKPIAASLIATIVVYWAGWRLSFLPDLPRLIVGTTLLWVSYFSAIVLLGLDDDDRLVLRRFWVRITS